MRKKFLALATPFLVSSLSAMSIDFNNALNLTIKNNKELKAKEAKVKKAKQDLLKAKGYNWGKLEFNENISKSNNPLYVFGMKLGAREATFRDFGFSDFLGGVGQVLQKSNNFNTFKSYMTNPQMANQLLNTKPDDLNNPKARTNYETKFVYEFPLFTGFKLSKAKQMALLQVKANEAKYNYDKKKLSLEVLKAYNGAVAAKYFIDATKKAKEATTSFVQFAKAMQKEGFVTDIDVNQARVEDLKIDSMLLEAKSKYDLALAYLRFLTSNKQIDGVKEFKSLDFYNINLNKLQQIAINKRDDLSWMRLNKDTMKDKIGFEKSAKYPMIGAHLEYGFNDDSFSIDSDKDYYVGAVGLKWNIFDGGVVNSEVAKAKIDYEKMKNYYEYMSEGIKLEVEKAYLTLQTKEAVLKQKQKAKSLAEDVLEQAKQMYKNQLITMNELLMQQAKAQQARAEAIMAKYEATVAEAILQLSIGKELK